MFKNILLSFFFFFSVPSIFESIAITSLHRQFIYSTRTYINTYYIISSSFHGEQWRHAWVISFERELVCTRYIYLSIYLYMNTYINVVGSTCCIGTHLVLYTLLEHIYIYTYSTLGIYMLCT